MSLHSTNYLGYYAGRSALDQTRPWQIILNPVSHHDIDIGVVVDCFATKIEAIAAILDAEALTLELAKEEGAK